MKAKAAQQDRPHEPLNSSWGVGSGLEGTIAPNDGVLLSMPTSARSNGLGDELSDRLQRTADCDNSKACPCVDTQLAHSKDGVMSNITNDTRVGRWTTDTHRSVGVPTYKIFAVLVLDFVSALYAALIDNFSIDLLCW